jgi:hypothetical protein
MTNLNSTVRRITTARRHEKSKTRAVVLSLEPPAQVGVRLQGTRQTYKLDAESVYELAVRYHERRIEKLARTIAKAESIPLKRATSKARRELAKELA